LSQVVATLPASGGAARAASSSRESSLGTHHNRPGNHSAGSSGSNQISSLNTAVAGAIPDDDRISDLPGPQLPGVNGVIGRVPLSARGSHSVGTAGDRERDRDDSVRVIHIRSSSSRHHRFNRSADAEE